MKKLSNKREQYCQERANGLNQSDSYLKAYSTSNNWATNILYVRASELEQRPEIQERILELRKPINDYLESKRIEIIQTAIDRAMKGSDMLLGKLIDKLLPTKTESKTDLHVKTFEDYLLEWKKGTI